MCVDTLSHLWSDARRFVSVERSGETVSVQPPASATTTLAQILEPVREALARVELEETLATIARLAPGTRLAGDPPRQIPGAIRTVDQMRATFA